MSINQRTLLIVVIPVILSIGLIRSQAAEPRTIPVGTSIELKAALKKVEPGDTILFNAGVWTDLDCKVTVSGRSDAPITLRADPQATRFTGRCRVRLGGSYLVLEGFTFRNAWHEDAVLETRADSNHPADHCRISRCTFEDCNPPDLTEDSKVVSLYGVSHEFQYCAIQGKRNRGATMVVWLGDGAGEHRIHHNYFGPRERLGRNGGETLRVGDSATSHLSARCIVRDNYFDRCSGEAEIISNKSCDNEYLFNTFHQCSGALTLRHGGRCRVVGNFFDGQSARGTGGVRIIGEDHLVACNLFSRLAGDDTRAALSIMNGLRNSPADGYAPVERACVAFNSFIDCKQSVVIGLTDDDNVGTVPPADCEFIGNIVNSRFGPLLRARTTLDGVRIIQNDFYGSEPGVDLEPSNLTVDPRWTIDSYGIPRLPQNSELSFTGPMRSGTSQVTDIDGRVRIIPTTMGCVTASTDPPARHPITAEEVGPAAAIANP